MSPRAGATDWVAVWVIFAGGLAAGACMTKVPPAIPALRADLGLGLIESGWIQTMLYTIGAAAGVFFGAVADRFHPGSRRPNTILTAFIHVKFLLSLREPLYRVSRVR